MNYSNKKTIEDINVLGKKVLLRCDFNVPLDENGKITNAKRIDASLKTINYLLNKGAKLIIVSHLGRPKGVKNQKLSLKPVADHLSKVLNKDIYFITNDIRHDSFEQLKKLKNADIALLENIRFYPEEERNDEGFSKKLASLADVYVNDAFGTAHRAHSSTCGITKFLPSVCGYLIKEEIENLDSALKHPKRPFVAVLGGAKVSDKIGVINNLLTKVDTLIIGGGMAYTFMNALGYAIGKSICESEKITLAKEMIAKAKDLNVKFVIPLDNVVGKELSPDTECITVNSDSIPQNYMGLDIGPKTEKIFSDIIKGAGTIIWNGPLGVFEWEKFRSGTLAIAKAIAESTAVSIVGGGDSVAAVELLGFSNRMSHISTGGGATLEYLEGKELPGISSLNDK